MNTHVELFDNTIHCLMQTKLEYYHSTAITCFI